MHVDVRTRVAVLCGTLLTLLACGGGASRKAATAAGPLPEAVREMRVRESPYYLIYSPPVNLAKPPDTTSHGRKPPPRS
ncbi:MAG TPA: hypothetical protein VF882_08410 [Gemmatimonadales bacterium]